MARLTIDQRIAMVRRRVTAEASPDVLRTALLAALDRVEAQARGARDQMEAGDYRLCPPDMFAIYVTDDIAAALLGASDPSQPNPT